MSAKVTKTSNLKALDLRLKALRDCEVYVGIPQDKSSRPNEQVTNAELAFIHEHGSPINNIPPRPFFKPALTLNKVAIAKQLSLAAKAVLAGDEKKANAGLRRTGMLAANAVKRFIGDYPGNNLQANAESTIRRKGSDHPLIDTGELRRSISYVVRPVQDLPQDSWRKSEAGKNGQFGSESEAKAPEIAKQIAKSAIESAEKVVQEAGEGIAEAGETLGEVAIL